MDKDMQDKSKVFEDWNFPDAKDRQSAQYGAAVFQDYAITTGRIQAHICEAGKIIFQTDEAYEEKGDALLFEITLEDLLFEHVDGMTESRGHLLEWAEKLEAAASLARQLASYPDQEERDNG